MDDYRIPGDLDDQLNPPMGSGISQQRWAQLRAHQMDDEPFIASPAPGLGPHDAAHGLLRLLEERCAAVERPITVRGAGTVVGGNAYVLPASRMVVVSLSVLARVKDEVAALPEDQRGRWRFE